MAIMNTAKAQYDTGGSAPTLATQGLSLKGLSGFRVIVSAASGQTISNTSGFLRCYLYSDTLGRWMRSSSFDIAVDESGARDFPSDGDFETIVKSGRVFFLDSGVTFSSGTGQITIEGI